jgi:hypothetical protein
MSREKPKLKDVAVDDSLGHYAIMFAAAMGAEVYVSVETYLEDSGLDDPFRLTSAVYPLEQAFSTSDNKKDDALKMGAKVSCQLAILAALDGVLT